MIYSTRSFDLSGLKGISDVTLETHFKLYEGYVKHTNEILERTSELASQGHLQVHDQLAYSELKRRLAFEYNGMVLHELYFDNLKKNGDGEPTLHSPFLQQVKIQWESFDAWRKEFTHVGEMRGVGWSICYQDPVSGMLVNEWITLHEVGHIAGFKPVLVMDVWEHAFMFDYKPAERSRYIDAFFSNVNWKTVESRLSFAKTKAAASQARSAI